MKIVIATGIFSPEIGGPSSYSMSMAKKLADRFSVQVITFSNIFWDKNDKSLPFKLIRVWKKNPKFIRHIIYFFKIFFAAKKSDCILALNAVSVGFPAIVAAGLLRKKLVIKVPGDYAWEIAANSGRTSLLLDDFQRSKKNGWIRFLHNIQTFICKKADMIIAPSEYLAKIVQGWGIDSKKIKVIYNGVDFEPQNITQEEARVKIGVPGNIILSVGRLVPWKGFKMLIKIMPQLFEINQFFRLVIVGSGPEFGILQKMIKNLRLDKKVYLAGAKTKNELATYFAAANIFVLNTGYEGFSHQILEAMAAGVPVITTKIGGNPEVIKQGENGFMVRYNDEFNLIEAIKTLFFSQDLRQEFIEAGKKTAGFFSVDRMIKETINFLELVVSSSN